jgi:hypothetical protein
MIFCAIYLQELVYNWFEPTFINYLENNLGDRKEYITTTFNNYI